METAGDLNDNNEQFPSRQREQALGDGDSWCVIWIEVRLTAFGATLRHHLRSPKNPPSW